MSLRGPDEKVSRPAPPGRVYPAIPPFRPAPWLPGPHAQTVWGSVARRAPREPVAREVLETPDGDELVLDHAAGPAGSPVLLVLHGLEGSSFSGYVRDLLRLATARGWRGVAMNFRSCARRPDRPRERIPNRRPRLYHSGETGDLDFVLRTLAAREPGTTRFAAGVSLGGNVLAKWLGENPGQRLVRAAASVSVPYDLDAGARHLERMPGRLYAAPLLASLRRKALAAASRFPEAAARLDVARVRRARTFREFDDAATAPLHGFAGVDDYYARASSIVYLPAIRTPTLCISALDDPFLPRSALERARAAASPDVTFAVTKTGGHVGFIAGPPWRSRRWAEDVLTAWFAGTEGAGSERGAGSRRGGR